MGRELWDLTCTGLRPTNLHLCEEGFCMEMPGVMAVYGKLQKRLHLMSQGVGACWQQIMHRTTTIRWNMQPCNGLQQLLNIAKSEMGSSVRRSMALRPLDELRKTCLC